MPITQNKSAGSATEVIQNSRAQTTAPINQALYPLNVMSQRRIVFTAYWFSAGIRGQVLKKKRQGQDKQRSVTLPIPFEITTNHGAQWSAEDLMFQANQEGLDAVKSAVVKMGQKGLKAAADATGFGANATIQAGQTVNPNTELAYVSHNLSTSSYTFLFTPKNLFEAQQVQKIKKFFQKESHGGLSSSDRSILTFPSVFNIQYYDYDGSVLDTVTEPLPCHLVDISIVENSHGFSSWIKGDDGKSYPTMTAVTLTFQEARMRLRYDFED